jgi:hypothetical protein
MDITKLQLVTGDTIKTEFEDCKVINPETSTSGYMRVLFNRKNSAEVNSDRLELFFGGEIIAYEGEETTNPKESDRVFSYKTEFVLKYLGEFNKEEITNFVPENEWFFKKDACVFFTRTALNFLSSTNYKNVDLPYQQ